MGTDVLEDYGPTTIRGGHLTRPFLFQSTMTPDPREREEFLHITIYSLLLGVAGALLAFKLGLTHEPVLVGLVTAWMIYWAGTFDKRR